MWETKWLAHCTITENRINSSAFESKCADKNVARMKQASSFVYRLQLTMGISTIGCSKKRV